VKRLFTARFRLGHVIRLLMFPMRTSDSEVDSELIGNLPAMLRESIGLA